MAEQSSAPPSVDLRRFGQLAERTNLFPNTSKIKRTPITVYADNYSWCLARIPGTSAEVCSHMLKFRLAVQRFVTVQNVKAQLGIKLITEAEPAYKAPCVKKNKQSKKTVQE